jgi:hypothetical protein
VPSSGVVRVPGARDISQSASGGVGAETWAADLTPSHGIKPYKPPVRRTHLKDGLMRNSPARTLLAAVDGVAGAVFIDPGAQAGRRSLRGMAHPGLSSHRGDIATSHVLTVGCGHRRPTPPFVLPAAWQQKFRVPK